MGEKTAQGELGLKSTAMPSETPPIVRNVIGHDRNVVDIDTELIMQMRCLAQARPAQTGTDRMLKVTSRLTSVQR